MAEKKPNKTEQLEATIESLQKEKTELLQRIQGAEQCLRSISNEKNYLEILVADLQSERDITNRNMVRLSKSIEKTVAANLELQEQLRATTGFTKGCHEILKEAKAATFSDKSTQISDGQEKSDSATDEVNKKLGKLTEELNLRISERQQLLIENKWRKENLKQVVMDNAYLKKVMAVLWDTASSLKTENGHLRRTLITFVEKEVASKLPLMEKKKEYIESVALNLRSELDRMKTLTSKTLPRLLPANTAFVRRLQTTFEQTSSNICSLLDEVKYYFPVWFKDSRDFYVDVSSCSTDLLQENVEHLKLLMESQGLKQVDQWCEKFKMSRIPALRKKLDEFLEVILQDIANLEQELLSIEAKVQELESSDKERKQYMANCSVVFSLKDFEKGIRKDTKILQALLEALKSKSQALTKARSEVVAKHACICWEAEAVIATCRKKSDPEDQEQEMLKDVGVPTEATAARELEEAKKLELNLTTVEQDMTAQLDAATAEEKEETEKLTAQDANSDAV